MSVFPLMMLNQLHVTRCLNIGRQFGLGSSINVIHFLAPGVMASLIELSNNRMP